MLINVSREHAGVKVHVLEMLLRANKDLLNQSFTALNTLYKKI